MTVVGHGNLVELFPDFKEDIQENGIDLRLGKLEAIQKNYKPIGCVNDEKLKPDYFTIKPVNGRYTLQPHNYYFATCDRPIHIPHGYTQFYQIRSTFARCGLLLLSSIGDDSFKGVLRMGLYNASPLPIYVGENERLIQAVTLKNDGTATKYDGDYQNDKIYYKKE